MESENPLTAAWWQRGVVYQVYPRSFQDSNGDGIGDLNGVRQRLGHLAWLGIDAIWLSPIFPSPMKDFGYDIADFVNIDSIFGTLGDFDALVHDMHRHGLKLILDFVPNHTSDRHPWFQEALRDRRSPRRDWYIWRDPAPDGGPPNNWLSEFGGSAWEFDEASGQYYYHAFLKEQPDLNWRNPDLVHAMHNVLRFWFDRGVDGFRIDVLHHLIEDGQFRDNPPNPEFEPGMRPSHALLRVHTVDQPEIQTIITGLRKVANEYPDRVLIGEIHLPIERLVTYYGVELSGIHLPFNFNLIGAPWSAAVLREIIAAYEAALPRGAWPNWVVGNHDTNRIASRVGASGARLAMMLLLTLRGTPTMYYGEEIGMEDVPIPPELVQDPFEKNVPGIGVGRDPARTPMRWTPDNHLGNYTGFTSGQPWLPIGQNLASCNVESQLRDPHSMLSLCHRLLKLRREHAALEIGGYVGLACDDGCLSYLRHHDGRQLLVMLNFSNERRFLTLPPEAARGRLLLSSDPDRSLQPVTGSIDLAPVEGIVVEAA
ncbi:MAG TPA: alpha-amylase family glycosyl hydrolase [Dongiaceae bacterium]|nr:alpha-amylase family glycosyl hydrolase [Dongiaceae bacterium]